MKKFLFTIIMAGIMLTGCGSDSKSEMEEAVSTENISITDVYDTISALTQEELVEIDNNLISNYYGFDTEAFNEYVFAQAESATSAETIIIVKTKDGVDAGEYEKNIENVLEQKKSEMNNYNLPDQVELIENAKTKFSDNGFYVVISDKSDVMAETIEKGLGL